MSGGMDAPRAVLRSPAATWPVWVWAVLAAGAITVPSLFVGFYGDDLAHRLVLEKRVPGYDLGPLELYDFTPPRLPMPLLIDRGIFPWFTSHELSLRFLRPVSSASLALDHWLFGRNPIASHLQSWVLMVALAASAAALYQRWFSRGAALHASLVFALSTAHGTATAWIAARHTLLATSLSVMALWAWVRYREDRWRVGGWLGPLGLVASLLSSESSLVGLLLFVGYEAAFRGPRRAASGPSTLGAALFGGLGLVYLAAYAALGYGARGSSFYISPFSAPLEYLSTAFWSVPALAAELLLAVPSALASFLPPARLPFALAALAAGGGLTWLLYRHRAELSPDARRALLFMGGASVLGLGVLIGAPVTSRVLPPPALGFAALIGNAIQLALSHARALPGSSRTPRRGRWRAALVPLVLVHYGLSPLLRVGQAVQFWQMGSSQRRIAEEADVGACTDRGSLYLLTGADPLLTLYTASALTFYVPSKGGAERFRVLGMAPQPVRVERPEPSVLSLEVLNLPHHYNAFERLYRPVRDPLRAGDRVALPELTAVVEAASDGVADRVRFEFREDLERLPSCLLYWQGGRLLGMQPAVGQRVTLPYEIGPLGL